MAAQQGNNMSVFQAKQSGFPAGLRWAALLWLVIWVAVYWHAWGAANFMHLCDIAVILTSIGLWTNSRLLISSQAVAALVANLAWAFAAGWRLILGRPLVGGMEYLFDTRYPLWLRLMSLYHLVVPALLLWALHRTGYDRRAWGLQSAIALPVFIASRFASPVENVNFAFTDPVFHRAWAPAPAYLAVIFLVMVFAAYLPTHLLLKHLFSPPKGDG